MRVVEERLRNAREKAQKGVGNISTLPPSKCITTIMENSKKYNEIKKTKGKTEYSHTTIGSYVR